MQNIYRQICRVFIILILILSNANLSFSQTVRINEFMALNQTVLADEDDDFSDWIEIYNPTNAAVNLKGWGITDEQGLPFKWVFPDITINPDEYKLLFASGKDKTIPDSELHTNFKLSGSGEYLALFTSSGDVVSEFNPAFPTQLADYSFGFYENSYIEFNNPTPGEDNGLSNGTVLPVPEFNVNHGFFSSPFNLTISSNMGVADTYYTTDGSSPSKENGTLYNSAIPISTTTIIRAISVIEGDKTSKITTQSYIFPADVIYQTNTPEGYPVNWGPYVGRPGNAIADYEMDQEMMADADFANTVKTALEDIPTISLVTEKDNFFSHTIDTDEGGIYIYTGAPGDETGLGWERPVSFEFFDNKLISVQADCGVRLQGGHSRLPEKSPKHSFLLVFKSEYGPSKLNAALFDEEASSKYNKLILRSGFGNSWIHHSNIERERAQYQRDIWTKDTQRDMGHPSSNSIYVHLYINGIYWGIYAPSERMDREFASKYMGGDEDDYDVIKDYAEPSDGLIDNWDKMMQMANAGLVQNDAYQKIQGKNPDGTPNTKYEAMVDVVNLADYMLINFYGSNADWDHHNWAAARNRVEPDKGFKFFCWDSEHMMNTLNGNTVEEDNDNRPSRVFQQLMENEEYKRLFANRVQKHCYNNGALTPELASARWKKRAAQIELAVYAESARWGDYRRDVHPYQTAGPFDLYTVEDHLLPHQDYMTNTFFPSRTDILIAQLRDNGFFPTIDAPIFYINDNPILTNTISSGDNLTMNVKQGAIYYTMDGTDPAVWNNKNASNIGSNQAISSNISDEAKLYTQPISLEHSASVIARTYYNNEWSAASKVSLILPSDFKNLKITEIHYNPLSENTIDGGQFEFIEIKNTGTSSLDISGFQFVQGIQFEFPLETELGAGEFIVLAADNNSFNSRYGFRAFDEFSGKLNNNGEWLVLLSSFKDTICNFSYNNASDWPALADGSGYSLVPDTINPTNNQERSIDWRASYNIGGSPGEDDILALPNPIAEKIISNTITLIKNYPNPFSDITYINYQITERAFVKLSVYNLIGQHIVTLVNENQAEGIHQVEWNGTNQSGHHATSGIYFYRIEVKSRNQDSVVTQKMILL